jgi:hypothetical protein
MRKPISFIPRNKVYIWFQVIGGGLALAMSALLLIGCVTLPADPAQFDQANLLGVVFDGTSQGVQGFVLTLDDTTKVTSDINGKFTFPAVPKGPHHLVASKAGHETVAMGFSFALRSQIVYITAMSYKDYLAEAELALRQSDFARAREQVEKALKLMPKDPVVRYLRAMIQCNVREYGPAYEGLTALIADGYRDTAVYLMLIDLVQIDPTHRAEVDQLIAQDAYLSKNPQIANALKRLETSSPRSNP